MDSSTVNLNYIITNYFKYEHQNKVKNDRAFHLYQHFYVNQDLYILLIYNKNCFILWLSSQLIQNHDR